MAKHNQKKKRTKKYAGGRARVAAERQDYRAGGRVGYAEGDVVIDPRTGRAVPAMRTTPETSVEKDVTPNVPQQAMAGEPTNIGQQSLGQPIALQGEAVTPMNIPVQKQVQQVALQDIPTREDIETAALERGTLAAAQAGIGTGGRDGAETDRSGWWTQYGYGSQSEALRTGRFQMDPQTRQWVLKQDTATTTDTTNQSMVDAKARAEQLVAGDMTGVPQIQAPEEVQVGDLGVAREMAPVTPIEAVTAKMPTAPEPVTVAGVERVEAPKPLTPAEMEAARIEAAPEVAVAEGEVRPEAIAEAAQVERVAPIEAAAVEIVPGALTERVVGTLSPEAKAEAARVAGTTLARVTRAKKQLANAGLSEEQIQALGNDPEDLESRLMDLSEEERGIIEGLPEEALVSTQLNGLLAGIEEGEIPTWARPAVASVEAMLAQRGLSASTVGRDALFNAIIQSAIPLAQSNAQAIQQSVGQQKEIEARAELQDAQFRQQTALSNADKVFQLNLAQFSADQQTALSNSKFLQTVGLTEAGFEQQAIVQNAVLMSQANLAEADFYQKAQIQNAQAFLAMDMQNLNNQQQSNMLRAQQEQQRLLSNQAAENAARQFNAASENQTQQFMTSLATQVSQYNATQANAMAQFNTQQINARQALEFQVEADLEKANAAMVNNINQFNSQMDFERDKFNVANAQAIEQSNLAWRRQVNTINTAAANQVAMQNAQNAFNMSAQAQSFLWQELRDQANYVWQSAENDENRKAQLYAQALANEGASAKDWSSNVSKVGTLINSLFGGKG